MKCDKCDKDVSTTHRLKGGVWVCDTCYYPHKESMAPMAKVFEPYWMTCGPINEKIPNSDPNKQVPNGVGDLARLRINSQADEKRYMNRMGVHIGEKGEKSQGHTIELKERRRPIYSFASKSVSS